MSPANIEQQLKQGSPLIGQAVAIGDRRPYNVALIVLDPDASRGVRRRSTGSAGRLARGDGRRAAGARGGQRRGGAGERHLSRVEQIKRFTVLPCDWAPAGDELTPTMKLKRKPIAAEVRGRDRSALRR